MPAAVARSALPREIEGALTSGSVYQHVIAPTLAIANEYFEQWAREGKIAAGDPRLTPRVFASMVLGVLLLRLMGDQYLETHWQAVPEALATLALSGLTPPKGNDDATVD